MQTTIENFAKASLAEFIVFDADGIIVEASGRYLHHLSVGDYVFSKLPVLYGCENITDEDIIDDHPIQFLGVRLPKPQDDNLYDFHLSRHPTEKLGLLIVTPNAGYADEKGELMRLQRSARVRDEAHSVERARFEAIYRQTPVATFAFDANGAVLAISDMMLQWFGSKDHAVDWIEWFYNKYQAHWLVQMSSIQKTAVLRSPISIIGMNVTLVDIEVVVMADNGIAKSTFIALRDVTAATGQVNALRRQVTNLAVSGEILHRSNRRLEQFAYVTAHDLVGPLGRIATYSEILDLELKPKSAEIVNTAISAIRISALESIEIVRELLELASIHTFSLDIKPLNVGQLADETVTRLFISNPISIIHNGNVVVNADARLLKIIIRNILANSYKYRIENIPVKVSIAIIGDESGMPILSFADNGSGFEVHNEDPFIAFKRMREHLSIEGTGLGLAMVKDAAIALGWDAGIASTPNQGTSVFFRHICITD